MKKIFMVLALAFLLLLPNVASAKSWSYSWKCGDKTKLDSETYYMVCELGVSVSDTKINHVEGNLQLTNSTVSDVEAEGNWSVDKVSDTSYSFTSSDEETGSISIAKFVFTGDATQKECEASIVPTVTSLVETYTCEYNDGTYYDSNGNATTKQGMYDDCYNLACTVYDGNYFDSEGNIVTKAEYEEDCNPSTTIVCKESDGVYYDSNGNVTTKQGMYDDCYNLSCQVYDGNFFDTNGNIVSKGEFYESCDNYTCTIIDDEYYFDSNGNLVTKDEMLEDCTSTTVEEVSTTDNTSNPKTGISYGLVVLPLGLFGLFGISKFARKNTKIYKI